IQEAIDDADDGDEIIVSPGTYCENIDFLGKNIVVHSADPTNPSVVSKTRIDGRQLGSVVTFEGMESAACLLSGFTICNGAVRDWPLAGGGIYGNGTLATIEYNIIMKNRVCPFFWPHSGYGGGLYDCDGTIRYNTVSKNHVCCYEGVAGGGGLFGCDGIIQSNIVSNNEAIGPGFANGGGFSNCNGSIENNTIVGNRAEYGGALSGCSGSIKSCIIWQNLSDEYGPQIHESNTPAYSCIGDWPGGGTGNTSNDPCFVRAGYWDAADPDIPWDDFWVEGDYHLLPDSPCINAGDPNYVGEAGERDMDGQPRVIGGRVDMGADEFVIEVTVKFTPGALNPCSKGKWVKAHLVLPEEYGVEDVNTNSPARIMLPVEIESEHMNVFVNEDGLVEVEAAFARAGLCEAGIDDGAIELGVIGWFRLKCLADFASYWLQGDCDKPDWCGGLDVSRDSVVNFVDFAMLEGCCM
ncbi:MAG: choice-of-anchor Q domain-containing protein, partial [Planctomycetota bacterium]